MGKLTGFLEYSRENIPVRNIEDRVSNYSQIYESFDAQSVTKQAARCMDCGISFCHSGLVIQNSAVGCPLGNAIPEINDLVYRGLYDMAWERLNRSNPFPEFTSYVCPAVCESSCTLGEHQQPVSIKGIEYYVADYARRHNLIKARPAARRTNRKVAIVGSGPSGLAAADWLSRHGEQVSVYERSDLPGGLLTYGIPSMKLDKNIIKARIAILEEQGVKFICNTDVGFGISLADLQAEYDAVLLAIGSGQKLSLQVPGSKANGVIQAMDFLTNATNGELFGDSAFDEKLSALDKNVIVLGSGDTGADCVAIALRQGARTIAQFQRSAKPSERRTKNSPWPLATKLFHDDYAHTEAKHVYGYDPREYGLSINEILTNDNGDVAEIITISYSTNIKDGKKYLTVQGDSETTRNADLVIYAMGFSGPENKYVDAFDLQISESGTARTQGKNSYATDKTGVFVAGDMRRGQSLVVWAIREGLEAAAEIHKYLQLQEKFST